MLRVLLIFLFLLSIFAGVILFLIQSPGFVSISYSDISIEITLVRFVIGLFIIFTIFYVLTRLVGFLFNAPKRIQAISAKRKQQKATEQTREGLTRYILGDWQEAEKHLLRALENSDTPCINYIWAARSAHQSGKLEMRDKYLDMVKKCIPEGSPALNVLQAELLLDQGAGEQALAALNQESGQIRNNSKIAGLFVQAYQQLNAWEKLVNIIPDLRKNKNLSEQNLQQIEKQTILSLLKTYDKDGGDLSAIIDKFESTILADQELLSHYIAALHKQNEHEKAEKLIASALKNHWDGTLVRQYGLLNIKDPGKTLTKAEKWLEHHRDDADLNLTLGRICKRAQLWGKAKTYLQASIAIRPQTETYAELSALHEQLDETEEAYECAKKGLHLITHSI